MDLMPQPDCPVPALSEAALFCAVCGRPVSGKDDATHDCSVSLDMPAAAGEKAKPFSPGTVVAERYRIVALLGTGGMGEVYRADDLKLEQSVALKFLPESLQNDVSALARIRHEVRLARQVTHPNVCRVFDLGEAGGQVFLSMEFVTGDDMASLLRRIGRLPVDKALEVAHQLCAGLAAAHAAGVLHRDLKPANVMLDLSGQVRITDFGLSAMTGEGSDSMAGTPAYMAPEQLTGKATSARSDLYSLGLILYEIFTGRPAHKGPPAAEWARSSLLPAVTPPSQFLRGLDPRIESVILHCLAADPAERPASADEIAGALPSVGEMPARVHSRRLESDAPMQLTRAAWLALLAALASLAGMLLIPSQSGGASVARSGSLPTFGWFRCFGLTIFLALASMAYVVRGIASPAQRPGSRRG
jgi:serine/threonine protein kinase